MHMLTSENAFSLSVRHLCTVVIVQVLLFVQFYTVIIAIKMQVKTSFLLLAIVGCLFVTNAAPRDSSILKQETVTEVNHVETKADHSSPDVFIEKDYKIPGRVICQFEEPTEDVVCQEHCLPKGYSYGICVSNTCSCV